MGNDSEIDHARQVATQVIRRLGEEAPPLRILDIGYDHGFDPSTLRRVVTAEPSDDIVIVIGSEGSASQLGAHYTVVVDRQDATAATADQIQDHALELTHGALLPPCPDHTHPLQARVVEGVASWVCPQDPTHHAEPIVPVPD